MSLSKEEIKKAIEYGKDEDWHWSEEGEEYPINKFNVSEAVSKVIELLDQKGIQVLDP